MKELLPRAKGLAALAKSYDIGFNIDAEEADRLDLSLDLLEALSLDPDLKGWNGLGFVIQAYGKRCSAVVDWLIDLARRSGRRLMIRLVKGAYWDSEIKRAQVDGLDGFPVFTRKLYTDVSYLACARKLLAAPDAVYPQFATHNAQTLASVLVFAGPDFYRGQYEFQCLHGMGEPLYEEVVGRDKLNRPCRVYAPVGSHETLLAYLVRRLLENGANTSFVNRIADASVSIDDLVADPAEAARSIQPIGAPHDKIAAPRDLYAPDRVNSRGLDLSDESRLAKLDSGLNASAEMAWRAFPPGAAEDEPGEPVLNPANRSDVVGFTRHARADEIAAALDVGDRAAPAFAAIPPSERAIFLRRAADILEARNDLLVGLIVREAGKSYANAVAEVREAADFLRYYAHEAARTLLPGSPAPLGLVVCISPWNFPLAIFTGQVAAALAAGNSVIAKPAEETPLIAAEAVRLLHEAGVPRDALQLMPGAGEVGAALVADPRVQGVVFTGSTPVARLIEKELAGRLTRRGAPLGLIAETGGLNAMVVDSSALAEQVVVDVLSSAFDSAGQRCSALRILCLQDDVADRMLRMLKGAMAELEVGDPRKLSVDVGPVITAEARDAITTHIEIMSRRGHKVTQTPLSEAAARGTFVPPTLIEVNKIADVEREVFGPVLHVLRYKREALDKLIDDINAAGYGLTFGLHTRIDETIARVVERIEAGNIYINRNVIGATVGVQPFGGSRLSGTGPKAGGPLYLSRLVAEPRAGRVGRCGRRRRGDCRHSRLRRLAFRSWPHGAGRAVRGNDGALTHRRARRAQRPGRRAQRLYASAARPSGGGRGERKRPSHPDRRDPGDRQRRGCQRRFCGARPFGIAGGTQASGPPCRGSIGRACPRLRPSRRRRGGDVGGLAQACEPRRANRAAAGAVQRAPRRRRGLQPHRPRRGMRDRHQHGRGRRQCEPDDNRLGCGAEPEAPKCRMI